MDKDTTQFTINELVKVMDETTFYKIINVVDIDRYVKKLTAYRFLQLFIIAQLNEKESLTRLAKHLKNNDELQTYIEFDAISTSQLSRKQSELSSTIFEKVFKHLVFTIQGQMKESFM